MHPSKEERPVSEKVIVLVSDRGDSTHGEVSVLDDPQKAERLRQALLGGGGWAGGAEGEPQTQAEAGVEETAPPTDTAEAAAQAEAGAETSEEEAVAAGAEMAAPARFSSLFRSASPLAVPSPPPCWRWSPPLSGRRLRPASCVAPASSRRGPCAGRGSWGRRPCR